MTPYLHCTFENGETALFRPDDRVWVCEWLSDNGEYYSGEDDGPAKDVVKPGVYVLDDVRLTDREHEYPELHGGIVSRVKRVRTIFQGEKVRP